MNIPIIFGMIASRSLPAQLFWQWYNQSYNVAVNHCNGNKTNPMSHQKVASDYSMAVLVSCGMVISMGRVVKPIRRFSPSLGLFAKATVPFLSVASAGVANVYLMRYNETVKGIELKDKEGKSVGSSRKAAFKAIEQVAMSRAFFPLPTVLLPALISAAMERKGTLARYPRIALPLNLGLIGALTFLALPLSIGLFPQKGSANIDELEDCFKGLKLSDGSEVKKLYFNKGL